MTNNRFVFTVFAVFFIGISIYAIFMVSGILSDTRMHFDARTQSLAIDLSRTDNHNTVFQNIAKAYFLNPSEKNKKELKHLGNVLRSRQNLLHPKALENHLPESVRTALREEIKYFDKALERLSLLLDKPGSLKAEQKQIEEQLRLLNESLAYIYTETLAAIQARANHQQAILEKLFQSIVILGAILVTTLLALIYFILKFHDQSQRLAYEAGIKDRLFSIIAHDLKSPFTVLFGLTHMMTQTNKKLSKDKMVEYANDVNTAAKQMYTLLQNLLDWSQLQLTGAEIEKVNVSLGKVVQENIDLLNVPAREKNIRLINAITNATAFADLEMTKTVIRNLISNSMKFTPQGGTVKVTSETRDNGVQVTVSDTGVGMSQDQMEKLFLLDQKTSTIGTGGETGTGLGLPLCRDMLERNGGRIWVESTPEKGSQLHFMLPTEPKCSP